MSTRLQRSHAETDAVSHPESWHYYTIGDLSREFGVTLRTLRFYEDRGLLSPVREGLLRLYDGRDRTRLRVILKGKQLGFTLSEIQQMVGDGAADSSGSPRLKMSRDQVVSQIEHLERQKQEIEQALRELRQQAVA